MILAAMAFATGVCLLVLPEIADFARPGADLLQVAGALAAAAGFVAMTEVTRGLRRVNVLPAVALAAGSFFTGMPPLGIVVAWLAAALLMLTALLGDGMQRDRYGGGWRALLR